VDPYEVHHGAAAEKRFGAAASWTSWLFWPTVVGEARFPGGRIVRCCSLTSEERKRNVGGGVLADCRFLGTDGRSRLRRYYVSELTWIAKAIRCADSVNSRSDQPTSSLSNLRV
jgi:hypothetical protein